MYQVYRYRRRSFVSLFLAVVTIFPVYAADIAYVWANRPTTPSYSVSGNFSFSPSGEPIQITRSSKGTYGVAIGASLIGGGGNVQVTAAGATPGYCKLFGWTSRSVAVACFDMAGDPADMAFTVLATASSGEAGVSYLLADRADTPSYAATAGYASSPTGADLRIERSNTGIYYVYGENMGGNGTNPQVTAVGQNANYCVVGGGSAGKSEVRCFAPGTSGPGGTLVDSQFSFLATSSSGPDSAFAWANDETADAYIAATATARSSDGADVAVRAIGKGRYETDLGNILEDGGVVQVSAYSRTPVTCSVERWGGRTATVQCFDRQGYPTYSEFLVLARRAVPSILVDLDAGTFVPPIGLGISNDVKPQITEVQEQLIRIEDGVDRLGEIVDAISSVDRSRCDRPVSWNRKLPDDERFALALTGGAYCDLETGLIWQETPYLRPVSWKQAIGGCRVLMVDGRQGWHLPTVEQLATLIDSQNVGSGPALPLGHPFKGSLDDVFWTTSLREASSVGKTRRVWLVDLGAGIPIWRSSISTESRAWCVRGAGESPPISEVSFFEEY
jgi:uncharacterized protein DUF1566